MSKKESIIKAAIDVVAQNGLSDSPTTLIAKEAGAAELTLFRLFGNKNGLLNQTYIEVRSRLKDFCGDLVAKEQKVDAKLLVFLQSAIKYFREKPNELSFFQQYLNSKEGAAYRPDIRYDKGEDVKDYLLVTILQEGVEIGVFKDLPMTALVSLTGVPIIMLLRQEQLSKKKVSIKQFDALLESCLIAIMN